MVCTGNICRSPLAEALLRAELAKRGVDGVTVSSAGTGASDGTPASNGSYLVGLEHGLDLSGHRARGLTPAVVAESDIILTMSDHHKDQVEDQGGVGRVCLLGEFAGLSGHDAEVPDPYGADLDFYRATYDQLEGLIELAAERLAGDQSDQDRRD